MKGKKRGFLQTSAFRQLVLDDMDTLLCSWPHHKSNQSSRLLVLPLPCGGMTHKPLPSLNTMSHWTKYVTSPGVTTATPTLVSTGGTQGT